MRKLIETCPTCDSAKLSITEVTCDACGTQVRSRYSRCPFCSLTEDQQTFLLLFVRSRGNLKDLEKTLGVSYPTVRAKLDEIVERLRQTPKEKKLAEGKRICVEIIQQVKEIAGVAGVHVMAYRQEELVAEIIEESGLLPRPLQPSSAAREAYLRTRRHAHDHTPSDGSQPKNPWRIQP